MPLSDLVAPADCSGQPGPIVALARQGERARRGLQRPLLSLAPKEELDVFSEEFLRQQKKSTKVDHLLGQQRFKPISR